MAIQRYEVDPLDGEYRCDSGNWVQYEDHLAEVALLAGQRDRLLAAATEYRDKVCKLHTDVLDHNLHEAHGAASAALYKVIAEVQRAMVQSTHGKEANGPAVSD